MTHFNTPGSAAQATTVLPVYDPASPGAAVEVAGAYAQSAPTQTAYPWRSTVRTGVQAAVGLVLLLPVMAEAGYLGSFPWLLPVVPIAAGLARLLAVPQVETYLKTWLPWLSAQPPLSHQDGTAGL